MTGIIETIHIDKAEDFLDALAPWAGRETREGFIFRGLSDAAYELIPSALRQGDHIVARLARIIEQSGTEEGQIFSERAVLHDFYKLSYVCGLYIPSLNEFRERIHYLFDGDSFFIDKEIEWIEDDLLDVAGLAQHYGIPTRLLDWTYDPLIAAFFATCKLKEKQCDVAVWGFNADLFAKYNRFSFKSKLKFITPPYHGNPNLAAQRGLFTHFTTTVKPNLNESDSVKTPIEIIPLDKKIESFTGYFINDYLIDKPPPIMRKVILSASQVDRARGILISSGYGPSRLFPGYGGVADELSYKYR